MFVDELASGALDLVGDVHGEIEVLRRLLQKLGYGASGEHPEGRRLVFVGDLCDRGPDSPAVVSLVARLVRAGRAQCVLGNHELNILREERKEGNAWYFGEVEHHEDGGATGEGLADDAVREEVEAFFSSLPLALERDDLRVTHACWHPERVSELRGHSGSVVSFSQRLEEELDERLRASGLRERARAEAGHDLADRSATPPMLLARAELGVRRQNEHPVKVLTSGLEEVARSPFWAGGKWRLQSRVPWWRDYQGPMVVVGHYWRSRAAGIHTGKGEDLFAGIEPHHPLGPAGNVMVVDYSIGKRSRERYAGHAQQSALAAFRWPEQQLVFAD